MTIRIDFSKVTGVIKPMHAVNNGPVKGMTDHQVRSNFQTYKAARIPYARTHDASFCADYGGEHTVDVHAIFPDFSKDPDDPKSYDFFYTDRYVQAILDAGTQVFFRLGSKIEHGEKRYGTRVPADAHKWAVICEHIIRHYNEGWNHGFHHNIVYWEIWNEPDGKPNWTGTPEQFYELYEVSATHLKSRFPHLKIGGPALSWFDPKNDWIENFFRHMTRDGKRVPLDFFSWHIYPRELLWVQQCSDQAREMLDRYGYTETESILNEYNYLINWTDRFVDTIQYIIGLRGAAFNAAIMCLGQKSTIDMLMYYDARPCAFNGLFDFYTYRPLKGLYPFQMFAHLYELGNEVESTSDDEDIYVAAAKNETGCAAMISYFRTEETGPEKRVSIDMMGAQGRVEVYILDATIGCAPVDVPVSDNRIVLDIKPDTVVFVKVSNL